MSIPHIHASDFRASRILSVNNFGGFGSSEVLTSLSGADKMDEKTIPT